MLRGNMLYYYRNTKIKTPLGFIPVVRSPPLLPLCACRDACAVVCVCMCMCVCVLCGRVCVCAERVRSMLHCTQDRCSVELLNTDDDFKKHGIRMDSPFVVFVGPSGEVVLRLRLTVTRVPMTGHRLAEAEAGLRVPDHRSLLGVQPMASEVCATWVGD